MLSDGNRQYSYDAMNRLKEVTNTDGSWQKNHYDGEGLRAELEENGKLVSFIYNEDKVVSEKTDNNTLRYIRGYDLVSSDSESARTYYHYACDELGSITHITDEAGNILNRYEYDAFGNFTLKEETIENRFAFTGEQYDPVSQLYYLRARFYSPAIARFMQEDTYYGDGLNLYSYCHNNPVMYVDPSGHWCEEKVNKRKQEYQDNGLGKHEAEIMANYDMLFDVEGPEAALKYLQDNGVNIQVDSYYNMTHGEGKVQGQAHHLSQDAAFGKRVKKIKKKDGLCVELDGNAFIDIGSQHYRAHQYMERFWNQYRKGGKLKGKDILLTDYNKALNHSLRYAGLSKMDAAYATSRAIRQQSDKKVGVYVPRLPGKINQKK